MPTHQRVKSKDEELASRRDESFRPRTYHNTSVNVGHPWRWRKRRIFAVIAGIVLLWYFLASILADGEGADETLSSFLRSGNSASGSNSVNEPTGAPPRTNAVATEEQSKHYYEGKIRFYRLAASLHAISSTRGTTPSNRNVLFAASSLRSAANLLPLACAMGKWDRSYVHFAIFGRDPMPIQEILEINRVDDDECHLFLHDARSDYSEYSTDKRAGVAVAGAMKHINDFMHPQAIIMDDGDVEDQFFTSAMRQKAKDLRRALIEIPPGRYEDFIWMTKLDSGSLASWHIPTIDILIHAPRQSSGGLLRTIKSLQEADYSGLKPPRLTIELPPDVDPFVKRQLEFLSWPPDQNGLPLRANALALRHRIPSSRMTSEQASLRFVESFYPTNIDDSHVLVLSSQAELSPLYYQYLYYAILEYRYSSYGAADVQDLLGVSLDVPNTLVNGKTHLPTPELSQMNSKRYTEDENSDKTAPVPFLYGAPTLTASLFFGDKWAVLHNFLKLRLAANHAGTAQKSERLVTEAEPVWMEYFLELIRAKGWFLLHPSSPFVTVHTELARIPEEYTRPSKEDAKTGEDAADVASTSDDPFLIAPDPPSIPLRTEKDHSDIQQPLHDILPFEGDLPELPLLPYVDHTGNVRNLDDPKLARLGYSSHFRRYIGGCSAEDADRPRVVPFHTADDLFCLPDMDIEFGGEIQAEEEAVAEAILEATEPPPADPDGRRETKPNEHEGAVDTPEATKETTEHDNNDAEQADG